MAHDTHNHLNCPKYEFYSDISLVCVRCAPFCRLYPIECSRTPECEEFRTDFSSSSIPTWATAVIVIVVILILIVVVVVLSIYYRKRLSRFCKFGCMFNFNKKKKARARDEHAEAHRINIASKWTSQDPVKPSLPYDVDVIRRTTVMERFFASIEQHPPIRGVDEMEPLGVDETRKSSRRLPDDYELYGKSKLAADKLLEGKSDSFDDNNSEFVDDGEDLITRQYRTNSQINPPSHGRASLDNRDIIENYHFRKVSSTIAENGSRLEVHDRPVQTGRRAGLNRMMNPMIGARTSHAQQTSV